MCELQVASQIRVILVLKLLPTNHFTFKFKTKNIGSNFILIDKSDFFLNQPILV